MFWAFSFSRIFCDARMRCCGKSGGGTKKRPRRGRFLSLTRPVSQKSAPFCPQENSVRRRLLSGARCGGCSPAAATDAAARPGGVQQRPAGREAKLQDAGQNCKGLAPLKGPALRAHKKARIKKRTKSRQIPPFGPKAVFFPLAGSRPPGRRQRIKLVRMPPSCCGKTAPACAPALMQRSSQAMFRARLRMVCSPS